MALHGDVSINGMPIIHWSARRTTALASQDQVSAYEVSVKWLDPRTGAVMMRAETTLEHKYSDRAEVLTSKVLTWAATQR